MVAGESPEWLPPGFSTKIKYKDGKKVKYYLNVATGKKYHSKKEVINCATATEENSQLLTPQTKTGNDNGIFSTNKVDAIPDKTNDSAAWLPNGWTVEEKIRKSGSSGGSAYKVYTELTTGSKFYSKVAVTRYLSAIGLADTMTMQNKIDNVDGPVTDVLPQVSPMTNTVNTRGRKRKGNSPVTIDNVDEPVPEKLPQAISTTNTGGIHEQKRKGKSPIMNDNMDEPSPGMSPQVISTTNTDGVREKKRKANSSVTVIIEKTPEELPSDWTKEMWISKSGNKTRRDPYYIDPVSGYMFRSKPDALRYLKTNDIRSCAIKPLKREPDDIKSNENKTPIDNLNEPVREKLPLAISTMNSGAIDEQKRKGKSLTMNDNVGEPSLDMSPQTTSATNTDGVRGKKRKGSSSVKVTVERAPDGLPSGWTKEIRTRKCGNGKDPYYVDPVSGYMFRSKLDALRYLETNDIRSCALKPLKRDSNGSSHANHVEVENNPKPENDLTEKGVRVEAVDVADPLNKSPESAGSSKKGSRKSKKTKDSILPTRASKRLAGSEPEMKNDLDLKELSIRAAVRGLFTDSEGDTSPSILPKPSESTPQTSKPEPVKEAIDNEVQNAVPEEAVDNEVQNAVPEEAVDNEVQNVVPEEAVDNEVQNAVPEEAEDNEVQNPVTKEASGEKPESQEEELFYDFGDSWSDPLDFALKTLRGEISVEPSPTFPSSPGFDQVEEGLKQPQSDAPITLQTEVASKTESLKKDGGADPVPASSPLFPAVGDIGFNGQASAEVGKKYSQTIFKP